MDLLAIISLLISIFGLIPLYVELFFRHKARAIHFSLQRFRERVNTPIRSEWSLRILHPTKPIEKCMILCEGKPLPWSYDGRYQQFINQGSGGIVRLPTNAKIKDAKIIVKDGTKTLKKTKFEKILLVEN